MSRDQNGNPVLAKIRRVRHSDGREGWAATCWSGGTYGPALDIRRNVYATREGAKRACVSDDYRNSDMISFNVVSDDWREVK
jgi:hypothetical protein